MERKRLRLSFGAAEVEDSFSLPDEVSCHVFTFLLVDDLFTLNATSRAFSASIERGRVVLDTGLRTVSDENLTRAVKLFPSVRLRGGEIKNVSECGSIQRQASLLILIPVQGVGAAGPVRRAGLDPRAGRRPPRAPAARGLSAPRRRLAPRPRRLQARSRTLEPWS